jgi:esterase/lipase superfamily enzyme
MAVNTVYFGTNRAVLDEAKPAFGNAHNTTKPFHYRIGEAQVEKVGDSWKNADKAYRLKSARLYEEHEGDAEHKAVLGSQTLFDTMRGTVADSPRDVIVFLHGFANTFESAMERAAELRDAYLSPATDTGKMELMARGREPLVFAFSWPSDGVTVGTAETGGDDERRWAYSSDREDARASGLAIARCTLRMIHYLASVAAEDRCPQRIHLVAHSMGNWALRHAVQALVEMSEEYGQPLLRIFNNAFLMGADLEDDALEKETWLKPLYRLARQVHVYHARNDSALSLSDIKPGHGARMGHDGPANMGATLDRTTAIDCAAVSWTPALAHVRHQYYRLAPEVLRDVRAVLAGKAPDEIEGRDAIGHGRWRIRLDTAARDKLSGKRRKKK